MLGYCGINCEQCMAYKGTIHGDERLLRSAAGAYWNGAYGAQDWVCLGCGPHNCDVLAKFCFVCKIRRCALDRKVAICAACDEFETCRKLQDFIRGESPALVRKMNLLRQRFLASQREEPSEAG